MFFGRLFSPIYSAIMILRAAMYRNGFLLRQEQLSAPVISVGNLVVGGSGKTPLVRYLAGLLRHMGKKPAILSRGYKGSADLPVNVVSDGGTIMLSADRAGDEPLLLAESLPDVAILTGSKRITTGQYAIDNFHSDIILLDDGFQHLAVKRDLDLVLFNANVVLGADYLHRSRVLPGGFLREPPSALSRADAFVITGINNINQRQCSAFKKTLNDKFPGRPVFTGAFIVRGFEKPGRHTNTLLPPDDPEITSRTFLAFCGIANPPSFKQSLSEWGINVVDIHSFSDHHHYCDDDLRLLELLADEKKCNALITTEKDLVKLRSLSSPGLPLYAMIVDLEMEKSFDSFITRRLKGGKKEPTDG